MGRGTVLLLLHSCYQSPWRQQDFRAERTTLTVEPGGACLSSLRESLAHASSRKDHEAANEGCVFNQQVAHGIWSKWFLVCPDAINNRTIPLFQNVPSPPWAPAQPQRTTNSLRHSFCHPSRMENLGRKITKP